MYKIWQLNDAQDRLIELLQLCIQEPQIVCDEDNPVAAVIGINLFKDLMKLQNCQHRPTIAELLDELSEIQADEPIDIEVPARQERCNPIIEVADELSM
jgi:hypothetical protein